MKLLRLCVIAAVILWPACFYGMLHARPVVINPYVTTAWELRSVTDGLPEGQPVCVAVGRGFKCAPLRAETRCMTPDMRGDWFDNHTDPVDCTEVLVLVETTRVEAGSGK